MNARIVSAAITIAALAAAVVLEITGHDAAPAWGLLLAAGGTTAGISIPTPPKG